MPFKPCTPCAHPGCPELTGGRYCATHDQQHRRHIDQRRGSSSERGYGVRWQKARKRFLKEQPVCRLCAFEGRFTAATVVDHIIPHKGDRKFFWDRYNWQPLCASCHSRKTAAEDGGFANPVRG